MLLVVGPRGTLRKGSRFQLVGGGAPPKAVEGAEALSAGLHVGNFPVGGGEQTLGESGTVALAVAVPGK